MKEEITVGCRIIYDGTTIGALSKLDGRKGKVLDIDYDRARVEWDDAAELDLAADRWSITYMTVIHDEPTVEPADVTPDPPLVVPAQQIAEQGERDAETIRQLREDLSEAEQDRTNALDRASAASTRELNLRTQLYAIAEERDTLHRELVKTAGDRDAVREDREQIKLQRDLWQKRAEEPRDLGDLGDLGDWISKWAKHPAVVAQHFRTLDQISNVTAISRALDAAIIGEGDIEIGGQRMTAPQFHAARFPLEQELAGIPAPEALPVVATLEGDSQRLTSHFGIEFNLMPSTAIDLRQMLEELSNRGMFKVQS